MYVSLYLYLYININIYTFTPDLQPRALQYPSLSSLEYIYIYLYIYIHIFIYIYVYMYICIYVYVYTSTHEYMYVYLYIYIYTRSTASCPAISTSSVSSIFMGCDSGSCTCVYVTCISHTNAIKLLRRFEKSALFWLFGYKHTQTLKQTHSFSISLSHTHMRTHT